MRATGLITLLAACGTLAACDSRVNVDAAANASTRYSSVLITVKEVWVHESATAAADDADWIKFPLEQPRTLDLVDADSAAMSELASELAVNPGTYRQIRLFLVDRGESLTESARAAGATVNDQVTFFDANGVETTVPLELADAAHGIGIETEIDVPVPREAVLAALAAASGSTNPRTGLSGATLGGVSVPVQRPIVPDTDVPATPVLPPTMPPGAPVPGPVSGSPTPIPTLPGATPPVVTPDPTPETPPEPEDRFDDTSVAVNSSVFFDATRDLAAFRLGDHPGFLLNPSLAAHDLDKVGNIQAELDVSAVALDPGTGRPDVEVTAEKLDEGSNRRVEVASAAVRADGTFTLYPLPLDDEEDDPTTYDLVIHGPAVTTVVIRGVPTAEGAPGEDSGEDSEVALGTITLIAADTFRTNLAAGSAVAPRGARVQFYQTLADDDAPFLIEQRPVDPVTGRFATDEPLSAAPAVLYGTFGETFSLVSAAPLEGAASFSVAAAAPLYGRGDFATTPITPPAASTSTATFTVPEIPVPPPAAAGTITANVTAATPGKYDDGALLVTHDGALVTAAPLSAALSGAQPSTVVSVPQVPAGATEEFERGLYYLEAWAWHSANPEGSFTRQPVSGAVDLRAASTASAEVVVN